MKKRWMPLITLALSLGAAVTAWAGAFEDYNDYQNPDGTYTYFFDEGSGVFVTMDEDWYRNTEVRPGDSSVSFYHRDSYDKYAAQGLPGGLLFSIGASVNTDFQELPRFVYLGFDEDEFMNYYAVLPTDYQAYMEDEAVRAEYDALWAGVEDVIAGIRLGNKADGEPEPERSSAFTSGAFECLVNADRGSVTISGYTGEEDVVEIPSEIDGYQVTDIAPQVFSYGEMTQLTLPESLKTIGERAFEYCDHVTEIEIPAGVRVGTCAFGYNDSLRTVFVGPDAVIGSRAFGYNDSLTTVFVGPDAVIESQAFGYGDRLETVICGPGSVLEEDTFEYCRELKDVVLCGDVKVEEDAFYSCDKMMMTTADGSEYEERKQGAKGTGGPGQKTSPSDDRAPGKTAPSDDRAPRPVGGWDVKTDPTVTEEAQAVFDQAMADYDRADHEAVALLATQVVAGINYCFLARTSPAAPNEQPSYQIVYIWRDIRGGAQVLEVKDIAFGLGGEEADPKGAPPEDGGHAITLAGDPYLIVDCPARAEAGQTVTVHTVGVEDGEVRLEVNGTDPGTWEDWGTYTFTMPDEDVELMGWISTEGYPGA